MVSNEEYDYIFMIDCYGQSEMQHVLEKFSKYRRTHDCKYEVVYTGYAPTDLHMNPSSRVVFLKHEHMYPNTFDGLRDEVNAILESAQIEKKVQLLNS